jgi:hypothetical protein
MAINRFLGTATVQAQVDTFTPGGTIESDDIFILTVTGFDGSTEVVSAAAGGTGVSDVTAALETAWNSASGTIIDTLTIADNTTDVTLTANAAGVAFKVTPSTTEAGGGAADDQTFTRAATVANGGPSDWQDANNWSLGTVPGEDAGGDDTENVYVEDSDIGILYGLNNTGATYFLQSLHMVRTHTGPTGHNGATGLVGDYLQVETANLFVGELFSTGTASGSGRIKINTGATQACDTIVYFTSNPSDQNKTAFRYLSGNASSNIKEIRVGSVGVAAQTGETTTIGDILVSFETSIGTDAKLEIGAGVTMTNLDCVGGETQLKCAATTVECKGGTLTTSGTGAISTSTIDGGEFRPASSGLITTCNLESGTVDFTISAEARTVTTLNHNGGNLKYDSAFLTITNGPAPSETGRKQTRTTNV